MRVIPGGVDGDPEANLGERRPPLPMPDDELAELKAGLTYGHKDGRRVILPVFENGLRILARDVEWRQRLRLNILTQDLEVRQPPWDMVDGDYQHRTSEFRPWEEDDYRYLQSWFRACSRWQLRFSEEDVVAIVRRAAKANPHHPIREWLDGLEWDGVSRLDTWLHDAFGCRQTPYSRAVGRWFLVSMVARAYQPGCQVDHVPVLEGPQGYGKSTALRELVGDGWYSDTHINLDSKDSYQALEGKWLIELGELASLGRKDMERVKSFVTERVSKYRPPYARLEISSPRGCVFVGTTNESAYLTDGTGNRRFWPVRVPRPIPPGTVAKLRAQLFAEAREAYQAGERWHPTAEEARALLAPVQATRTVEDPWTDVVRDWLGVRASVTLPEVLRDALGLEWNRTELVSARRLAGVMARLGWRAKHTKTGTVWLANRPTDPGDVPTDGPTDGATDSSDGGSKAPQGGPR